MLLSQAGKNEIIPQLHDDTYTIKEVNHRINEFSKLIQLTSRDFENVKKIDSIMEEHSFEIAKRHYEMIMMIPEIKQIFNENSLRDRYTAAIGEYFKQLTKPKLSKEYVAYRKRIGRVHSRIKLVDEWYIGSYLRVYEYLLPIITKKFRQ